MPIDAPGDHTLVSSARPVAPTISASRGQIVITGHGFMPDCPITVRVTYGGEDVVDYLTFVSDAKGFLSAELPVATASSGTWHSIAVTDHRLAHPGDGELLWSNTVVVSPTGE